MSYIERCSYSLKFLVEEDGAKSLSSRFIEEDVKSESKIKKISLKYKKVIKLV